MLYIIDKKPYIRVSSYYKPVKIEKKGNEYIVVPIGDKTNRVRANKNLVVTEITVKEAFEKYSISKANNNIDNI